MTREEMQAEIEKLNKLIKEKDALIQRQSVQIENMMQALLHARRERFGAKSEASVPGQLSLFSDAERRHLPKHWKNRNRDWLFRIKSRVRQKSPVSAAINWHVFRSK